ncbi:MAG: hypothetical protein ACXU7H_07375 [Burkholderiaceae bacterium]
MQWVINTKLAQNAALDNAMPVTLKKKGGVDNEEAASSEIDLQNEAG